MGIPRVEPRSFPARPAVLRPDVHVMAIRGTAEYPNPRAPALAWSFQLRQGTFSTGLNGVLERYRQDGAYDYIIGYYYDWSQDPLTTANQISSAVNGLGLNKIDIFAHSYGGVNALATIPLLGVSNVDNLVLYDVPLNGSLLDSPNMYEGLLIKSSAVGSYATTFTLGTEAVLARYQYFYPGKSRTDNHKAKHGIERQGRPCSEGDRECAADLSSLNKYDVRRHLHRDHRANTVCQRRNRRGLQCRRSDGRGGAAESCSGRYRHYQRAHCDERVQRRSLEHPTASTEPISNRVVYRPCAVVRDR